MEHRQVFSGLLNRNSPDHLDLLHPVSTALGWQNVGPLEIDECHPLVTPFAVHAGEPIGLLHWPTPQPGIETPVVRVRGSRLELLAASCDQWVKQELARLDHEGAVDDTLLARAEGLVAHGAVATSGVPWEVWVILKGGGSPRVYRGLLERHLNDGDTTSALVAAERAGDRYPGWAEPHAWRYRIHTLLGDGQQARDAATAALGLPIWTLLSPFAPLAEAIGWSPPHDGRSYERLSKDAERLPADRAAYTMDHVAVTGGSWAQVRKQLHELYAEAELHGIATLVNRG